MYQRQTWLYLDTKMWLFSALLHWICFGFIFCNENDLCNKDYSVKQKCENLSSLDPNLPSIFILHAKGRLGNHLMAFAIVPFDFDSTTGKILVQCNVSLFYINFICQITPTKVTNCVVKKVHCNSELVNLT